MNSRIEISEILNRKALTMMDQKTQRALVSPPLMVPMAPQIP